MRANSKNVERSASLLVLEHFQTCRNIPCYQRQKTMLKLIRPSWTESFHLSIAALWERASYSRWDTIAAHAVRVLACELCNANEHSFRRVKRVVWYLYRERDLATFHPCSDGQAMRHLVVNAGRDWPGDCSSCAVLRLDGCGLRVICRGQQI